jgi:hypothetical protein
MIGTGDAAIQVARQNGQMIGSLIRQYACKLMGPDWDIAVPMPTVLRCASDVGVAAVMLSVAVVLDGVVASCTLCVVVIDGVSVPADGANVVQ